MIRSPRPATGPQRRIALAAQLRPHDPGSNFAFLWRLPGGIDPARLATAVERAFDAQDGLREQFDITARGDVVAVPVDRAVRCAVRRYDDLDDLRHHVAVLGDTARDIACWPLFDIEVALIGDDGYFVFAGSHLVGDSTMLYLLLADVDRRYADLDAEADQTISPSQDDPPGDRTSSDAAAYFGELLAGLDSLAIDGWARRDRQGRIPGRLTRHEAHPVGYRQAKDVAAELGVRRYSVLLTVFGLIVTALSGQDRVVVSTPVSGRHGGGTAARIRGLLTNALPVLIDTDRNPTFTALCRHVDEQMTALIAVETCSFTDAVRGLLNNDVEASLPSASFTLYPQPLAPVIAGAVAEPVAVDRRYLQYPLTVNVEVRDGRAALLVERAEVVEDVDVDGVYWHVFEQITQNPGQPLSELSWCPGTMAASRVPIRAPESSPDTIVDRFAAAVARHPHAVAVEHCGTTIEYADLARAADAVAGRLAGHPGDMIGVAMEPGIPLVATVLGILKAGRTYVPIRTDTPADRLAATVESCGGLAVTGVVDPDWDTIPGLTPLSLEAAATTAGDVGAPKPSDTAYVIFTSGTTGRPKGVQISHESVVGMLDAAASEMSLAGKRWSWYHSFAFDVAVWEMFGPLLFDGVLCIPDAATTADPAAMAAFIDTAGIQVLSQTPSAFEILGPLIAAQPTTPVESVVFFGERLDFASLTRFATAHPTVALVNMYGITEITVHATFYQLPTDPARWPAQSVIGRPLRNTEMAVVDRRHRVLPRGVQGELAVGGGGVMIGYLGQPELTRSRIVDVAGTPMYLSGDRGYLDAAGQFVYLDRLDTQVQVRGHRIELGEVEHVIRVTGLADAACVLAHGEGISRTLIAFVVLRPGCSTEQLREAIARKLTAYMVPSHIVALPVLPVTVNGKVDRRELIRRWEAASAEVTGGARPVRRSASAVQAEIVEIWADVLGHGDFGPDTRFFEAGGTSAALVAVSRRLRTRLDVESIDIVDLFEHCTPASLAGYLADAGLSPTDGMVGPRT